MTSALDNPPTRIDSKPDRQAAEEALHPAWRELRKLCESMGYGEIERLKIHDGVPVLAEITRQKVKLS